MIYVLTRSRGRGRGGSGGRGRGRRALLVAGAREPKGRKRLGLNRDGRSGSLG